MKRLALTALLCLSSGVAPGQQAKSTDFAKVVQITRIATVNLPAKEFRVVFAAEDSLDSMYLHRWVITVERYPANYRVSQAIFSAPPCAHPQMIKEVCSIQEIPGEPLCHWILSCSFSLFDEIRNQFVGPPSVVADAVTFVFNKRTPPDIPAMITFFRPGAISRKHQNLPGPRDADNMVMVCHEALHAYTRLIDNGGLDTQAPSLKKELGCNTDDLDTYDITSFLMQFTNRAASSAVSLCTSFSGTTPKDVIQ